MGPIVETIDTVGTGFGRFRPLLAGRQPKKEFSLHRSSVSVLVFGLRAWRSLLLLTLGLGCAAGSSHGPSTGAGGASAQGPATTSQAASSASPSAATASSGATSSSSAATATVSAAASSSTGPDPYCFCAQGQCGPTQCSDGTTTDCGSCPLPQACYKSDNGAAVTTCSDLCRDKGERMYCGPAMEPSAWEVDWVGITNCSDPYRIVNGQPLFRPNGNQGCVSWSDAAGGHLCCP